MSRLYRVFSTLFVVWLTATSVVAADLKLQQPVPWTVVQRVGYEPRAAHTHGPATDAKVITGRGHADVSISWERPEKLTSGTAEARVVPLEGAFGAGTEWTALKTKDASATTGTVRVPAGGWYRLEVRLRADNQVLATGIVEPVGVGEVFLVAGQSYATNTNDEVLKVTEPEGRVAAYDWETSRWRIANDPQPTPDRSDGGSIWPVLGDTLVPLLECPVGFVNVAWGGTSSAQWMPGEALHKRLVEVGQRVGNFRAVLWQQGESDVIGKVSIETYVQNLTTIRQKAAKAWGHSPKWLLAKSTLHPTVYNDPEGEGRIRAAIEQLWKQDGFGRGPDTDILGGDNRGPVKSRRHFSPIGQRRAAMLWFATIWRELETGG